MVKGLDGPRQISDYRGNRVVVAESDSGEISSVDLESGEVQTLISGLLAPQGVDYADGLLYIALGGPPPPEDTPTPTETAGPSISESAGPSTSESAAAPTSDDSATSTATTSDDPPAAAATTTDDSSSATSTSDDPDTATATATQPGEPAPTPGEAVLSSLVIARPDGEILKTIDLEAYERAENPDGQTQFEGGQQFDSLSNPFAVLAQGGRVLVADAGANAVLSVDRESGEISPFFVPPVVSKDDVAACGAVPNNPGTVGCDPVPTGIAEGRDGLLYVSTLGAEAPGAGRVYVLDSRGEQVDVIEGLTSPTGVEVDRHGTVYVSNVIQGAPEGAGPPPTGFDFASVGELTRIARDGSKSTADVTMPTGLLMQDGDLYASAWSIASLAGLPAGSGQVARIDRRAFTSTDITEPTATSTEPTATSAAG